MIWVMGFSMLKNHRDPSLQVIPGGRIELAMCTARRGNDNVETWMKLDQVLYSLPRARSKFLGHEWMGERKTIHRQSWYKSQKHMQQSTHEGEKGWSCEVHLFDLDDIVALDILESKFVVQFHRHHSTSCESW